MLEPVKIYNNLKRKKEDFAPLEPGKVRFYSCGPTTYDFLHVGNARALVVGDLINRILGSLGYDVTFVRNFTDVDDKIIERANKLGVDALEHASRFVRECEQDMKSLGMKPADHTPKVSETIVEIVEMIKTLIEKNHAYDVEGEVFFHVPSFKTYGELSKKDLESLEHGRRVEVDKRKKHPSDFVLWKPAKPDEPSWDSPWGKGRPGWHIECSAMAKKFLGSEIDIHHGGVDLIFPHHENEIAQSECANGHQFSRNWCHNEFLNFGKEKMSKSLGNVVTIRSFVEKFGGEVLRQILMSAHYRSVFVWNDEVVQKAISDVERIHEFLLELESFQQEGNHKDSQDCRINPMDTIQKIKNDLANDFNVPGALGHFFSFIRDVRRDLFNDSITSGEIQAIQKVVHLISESCGGIYQDPKNILERVNVAKKELQDNEGEGLSDNEIDQLLKDRVTARSEKNWARADEIRDTLKKHKIAIKDNPDGTTSWSYE